ncbi:MAG: hypothetical protein GY799_24695, partial [Desulfobulbaceae bacterium]|nr:hypothetical protein [Desulfobulbaceae bacterium]
LLCLSLLSACSKTEREEAVYQLVADGVTMAEAHDLGGMMSLMADGFIAGPGQHSKQESRRILFVMLKRYGKFRVLYPRPVVKLSEDEQTARVKMNFLIATKGQLFPELELLYADPAAWVEAVDKGADLYTLSMQLSHGSGDWLLGRARITSFASPHGRM